MPLIDTAVIGTEQERRTVQIERGLLRMFARSIGELDPVYTDVESARSAGHPDLPVPPTYFFGLNLGRGAEEDMTWMRDLGIDVRHILHGEQVFRYHDLAHAGDELVLAPRIKDVVVKRGGALQFVVRETSVTRPDGTAVADLVETIAVLEPQGNTEGTEKS